jgi:transcriptional regulator with XRE-family HTH domain
METRTAPRGARRILLRLRENGWSYVQIAHQVGISERTLYRYAQGQTVPVSPWIVRTLQALLTQAPE